MSALRITIRALAALTMTAVLTCGTVAIASASPSVTTYPCYGDGYGATSAAAHQAAVTDLYSNYSTVYQPIYLLSDTESGGIWHATVGANCSGMLR